MIIEFLTVYLGFIGRSLVVVVKISNEGTMGWDVATIAEVVFFEEIEKVLSLFIRT